MSHKDKKLEYEKLFRKKILMQQILCVSLDNDSEGIPTLDSANLVLPFVTVRFFKDVTRLIFCLETESSHIVL